LPIQGTGYPVAISQLPEYWDLVSTLKQAKKQPGWKMREKQITCVVNVHCVL